MDHPSDRPLNRGLIGTVGALISLMNVVEEPEERAPFGEYRGRLGMNGREEELW